ncbi:VanW family protein [Pseudoneobacillus sp. C159]
MKLLFPLRITLIIFLSTFLIFSFSHFGTIAFKSIVSNSQKLSAEKNSKSETEDKGSLVTDNINQKGNKPLEREQILHTVKTPIVNEEMNNIGATLIIEPQATFSMLSFLEKQGLTGLNQDLLGFLSSGTYQTILPTNFQVVERHIGMELQEDIPLGYEAKVDPKQGLDLSFHNPNKEGYKMTIFSDGQSLVFNLEGLPFPFQYSITESKREEFTPKTIRQYSPFLNPGQTNQTKVGKNGLYIELKKQVLNPDGSKVEESLVSKDYYPPIHRVEVVGIQESNQGDLITENKANEEYNGGQIPPENPKTEGNHSEANSNDEQDPLWGKPDETEK